MFDEIWIKKRGLGKSNANVALSLSPNIGNNSSSHCRDTFSKPGHNSVLEKSLPYSWLSYLIILLEVLGSRWQIRAVTINVPFPKQPISTAFIGPINNVFPNNITLAKNNPSPSNQITLALPNKLPLGSRFIQKNTSIWIAAVVCTMPSFPSNQTNTMKHKDWCWENWLATFNSVHHKV